MKGFVRTLGKAAKGMGASSESRRLLGEKIRQMRMHRSWPQAQLAEVAGVSTRTVQRLERSGKCSHETLLGVAQAFDVDVRELTGMLYSERRSSVGDPTLASRYFRRILMASWVSGLLRRRLFLFALLYVVLLAMVVGYGIYRFDIFDTVPPPPRDNALLEFYQAYDNFLRAVGLLLALYLGIWSAFWGVARRRALQGFGLFLAGVMVSAAILSLLPWIYFKYDQYSAGAAWVMGNLLPAFFSWLLATTFGRMLTQAH